MGRPPPEGVNVDYAPLPSGVNFQPSTSSTVACAASGANVTCELLSFAPAASSVLDPGPTVAFPIVVVPTTAGIVTNRISVGSATPDPDNGNNSVTVTTAVSLASADLSVAIAASPDPALVGQPLIYTISVANGGPQGRPEFALTDILPSGVTFDSVLTPLLGGCSLAGGVITCSVTPDPFTAFGVGATATF